MKDTLLNTLLKLVFYLLLLITSVTTSFGQDYFIETTFPTSGVNRFSVCGGDRTINVKLTNTSGVTLTNDTLTFSFPVGFDYTAGTLSGTGVTEVDTTAPSFAFTNVGAGDIVEFSINVEVLCSGIANATGAANTNFDIDVIYTGGSGSQNYSSAFFEVVKPTLSITQIGTRNSTNPEIFNAAKYNSEDINVTVANGGNGPLSWFEYCLIDHPQLNIDSISIAGYGRVPLTRTSGDSSFFMINTAMIAQADPYTGPGADPNDLNFFQFNETLVITEHWTAIDCSLNPPDLERGILYRCQSDLACEGSKTLQGVRFGYTRPDLTLKWDDTFGDNYPVCTGDTLHYYGGFITNSGTEAATDMRFSIYVGADSYGGTFLDTSSIQFSTSSTNGPYFKYPIAYTEMVSGMSAACLASAGSNVEAIRRANYFMEDFILMPGDTLFIKFAYRVGCYCGDLNRNDCSRILASRDFRRIIYGYYNPNDGVNTGSRIEYWDACKQFKYRDNYIITQSLYYYYNTLGEGEGATLTDNQVGSVYYQGQRSLSTLAYHSNYFNCQSCYTDYLYIFPEGVDWAGTDGDLATTDWIFADQNGDTWTPDMVSFTNNPTGLDTLRIRVFGGTPSGFSMNANSIFTVNYRIDCSEVACGFYSGVPIKEETFFVLDTTCSTCDNGGDQVDCQESVPITFYCTCPSSSCEDGMVFKDLTAERRTFGKGDDNNNTIAETGETLDTTKILLSRVLPGDTIRTVFKGEVNVTNLPGFEYAFAEVVFPSPITDFLPVGANVTIYDVSAGTTITCNVLQQFIDGNKLVTNISSANLRTLGCTAVPANWVYEDGDSLTVEVYFMTRTNVGGTVSPKVYNTNFYVSDEDYGGATYQCNPRDFLLTHIGYAFYNSRGSSYTLKGCNVGYMDVDHRMRIGASWGHRSGADLFPFEVREPFYPQVMTFIKNSDLRMTGTVLIRYYPLLVNNPGRYQVNYKQATIDFNDPHVTILGDTVLIDVKGWLDANGNGAISYDQGFYSRVYVQLQANCSTDLSSGYDKLYSYDLTSYTDPRLTGTPNYSATYEDVKDIRLTEKPNLTIQVTPKTRQIIESPTCFSLDLINAGDASADHVYFAFDDFNGSVIAISLYEVVGNNRTLITPTTLGLYQIGLLNKGKTRSFELCVQSNNCAMDSLKISTGWDCMDYPTSLEEAECGESDKVYLVPLQSELGMVISEPISESTLDLCEELTYEVTLSSADIGSLNDIHLYFRLPPNMSYQYGSMELLYPVSGSYQTIADPTKKWGGLEINVSEQEATLASTGLPGTIQIGQNVLKVRFKVQTECNYSSGSRVKFLSYAYNPCGDFANYRFSPAPKHHINGVSTPFASSINIQGLTLNACAEDNSTLNISMSLASGSQATGSSDSVAIILPPGVRYVSNSYTPISNAVVTNPMIEVVDDYEIVYVDLKDGVTSGNSIQFRIDIEAFDVGQDCRDYDITVQSFNSQNAMCVGTASPCNVRVVSSETSKNITIEKPSYTIDWNNAMATPISADTLSLAYTVTLQNNAATPIDSTVGVVVEIYNDTDGDGRYSTGDVKVGTSVFNSNIGALETIVLTDTVNIHVSQICNLLAVVNPETACACSEDESFLIDAELNNTFTRETSICSNGTVIFGPETVTGYTYEWFGINGADINALSTITNSPTQFTYDNNTGGEVIWEYVVRIISGANCYSYDTMKITVYPEIDDAVTSGTCVGFPTTLNGPAGSIGVWSPTTNVNDVNDPNSGLSGISTTTTYTWTYTDPKGCTAYFRQTVALTGCSPRTMIGDYVWRDDNRDGIQDTGEPPLENVPVYLYDADDPTVPLATVYTDANGYYEFKPIPAGNYRVGFGNPYDYDPSPKDVGSDDEEDSDMNPGTFYTDAILVANGDSITTVDAGFMPMQKIGNFVWSDLDSNGVQDVGELPIEGVTVHLYKADGTLMETTTTNASGAYVFRVIPDTYYLVFDHTTNTSGINYVSTPQSNSGDAETDSDPDALGKTANFTVAAGQDRFDIDAGFKGVEDCGNGIDDDSDGLTDCSDSDCLPVIDSVLVEIPTCAGGSNDGKITIYATGLGTLSYSINNSPVWQTSNEFPNLGVGLYYILVKNDAGCTTSYTLNPVKFDLIPCTEICDDNIDNDNDGLVDCDDPDCGNVIPTSKDIINND